MWDLRDINFANEQLLFVGVCVFTCVAGWLVASVSHQLAAHVINGRRTAQWHDLDAYENSDIAASVDRWHCDTPAPSAVEINEVSCGGTKPRQRTHR